MLTFFSSSLVLDFGGFSALPLSITFSFIGVMLTISPATAIRNTLDSVLSFRSSLYCSMAKLLVDHIAAMI